MKKIKFFLGFALGLMFFIIPNVNADTFTVTSLEDYSIYSTNKDLFEEKSNQLINYYNSNLKDSYNYYFIKYSQIQGTTTKEDLFLYCTNNISFNVYTGNNNSYGYSFQSTNIYYLNNSNVELFASNVNSWDTIFDFSTDLKTINNFNFLYYANFPIIYNLSLIKTSFKNYNYDTLKIDTFYNNSSILINEQNGIPLLRDLLQYDSFEDYQDNNNMTTVNLDNYKYVILSLKDYSKKDAFDTNLQVKGMIGITPVYEYGTVEKNTITDRCNISYDEFTDYRLYVLKDDLVNNSVYYVKACEKGSSFKFDNTIFNITYVTAETVDDPVITVGGKEYHTIPFDDLNNSANENEEENFIPGENGSSLTDIIDNATSFTSDIWNAFKSFMSLATKFFNALPQEFKALSITGFTVLITIAVIKFIKS